MQLSDDTITVAQALERYLRDNGFSAADYDAPTFAVRVLGRDWRLPNGPARRRAIPLHDLHHVATGYATDLAGEAEMGAWELAAGCDSAFLLGINVAAVLVGLFLAPRRVVRAAAAGRRARSLYTSKLARERALAMTVTELRLALGVPSGGTEALEPTSFTV